MMRINLLPKEERGRSANRTSGFRVAWLGVAALFLFAMLLTTYNVYVTQLMREQEADLFARVTELKIEQSNLSTLRRENDELGADVEQLQSLLYEGPNDATGQVLHDVAASVPSDAGLVRLSMRAGSDVFAAGYTAETGDLSMLLRKLNAATGVDNVHLSSMDRVAGADGPRREFTLNVTLKGWEQ